MPDAFTITLTPLDGARGLKAALHQGEARLSLSDVLELWRRDASFAAFFTEHLAQTPFECFRWETPAATTATLQQPYEHVVIDAPALAGRAPDQAAFSRQLSRLAEGQTAAAFDNLGGDAALIAPAPLPDPADCTDLAAYARAAPPERMAALWRAVSETMSAKISATPIWLSTAGGGVAWLHVRIDQRPKYYTHKPYRLAG